MHAWSIRHRLSCRHVLCLAVYISLLPTVNLATGLSSTAIAGQTITAIDVAGSRRVESETVRSYLRFNVGDTYDPAKVDQSIKALFATGLFADVRIDRDGPGVRITVRENPVVNQVAFEGNSEVEKATLVTETQIKPRSVYTRSRVQADVKRILEVYRRQGRFAAMVEPKIIELDSNRVNVVFEIDEGKVSKVKAINFLGNKAFTDAQLRDVITTTQSGLFDFIKGTNIYDPDRLTLDRELVRQYYLKNGYADARVASVGAELDPDGSGFLITFVVEEGEIFTFGTVDIQTSLKGLDSPRLRKEVLTTAAATYDLSAVDKTVERLSITVSDHGYDFARVRPRVDRHRSERIINILYVIDEGPRIYIERLNISGNQRTLDYVMRREFRLSEGDAYNPATIEKAKKRLQALGFFKTVEIKRRQGSAPDRVILEVEVVEQSSGDISFGAGYSSSEGVIGEIAFTERNLMGKGQFLRLKLSGSTERLQVDLSFTEPRFLDSNVAAGFDLFHKVTSSSDDQPYEARTTGGALRASFPLNEQLWLTNTYTLTNNELSDIDDSASLAIKQAAGTYWTSAWGSSLAYDGRNHPKSPTRGVYLQGGAELAGLGGDVRYVRFTGEGRFYYPIANKVTFVGRSIAGHIMGWGGEDVRLLDLFHKGGETIRGFDTSGYGPRDLNTGDALGGRTFWATTAEVRFPFPFVTEEIGLSGAIFADAGSLFGAGQSAKALSNCGGASTDVCLADSSAVRTSIGASIIWDSPLGPLRFDFAKAITKEKYDDEQLFKFGASTKF